METLKITANALGQMCRLCLSRDMTMDDIFCFSSELGKNIVDIIMECAPVQIARHDKKPTYICQLCFTELKKFHQFQMQIVRSDKKLQRHLQQMIVGSPQISVTLGREEQASISASQNYNADVAAKCEPFEINDEFDNSSSKQKMFAKFSSVNIPIKLEIKDEPMDDDSLIATECAKTAETLSTYDNSEISCKNSVIEVGDTKIEYFECPIKFENDMREKIPLKSEEISISDSGLCCKKIKDFECLRSNEDNMNRVEHPINKQNLNENSDDSSNLLLKKSTTSTREKSYPCDICQKCFRCAQNLKKHKLIHTGEKPYQCDICKMCFRTVQNLKSHKLIHTGEKPYQCDICQMRLRQLGILKQHHLQHTGEKPYQCDICKMCFTHRASFRSHKLIHTGEKPYQCNICKMSFTQRVSLKGHKLTHTGEKPYQCDICKMYFKYNRSLKGHRLIHTGEKPYQCDICQMCFTYKDSLKTHKLKHTEIETTSVKI